MKQHFLLLFLMLGSWSLSAQTNIASSLKMSLVKRQNRPTEKTIVKVIFFVLISTTGLNMETTLPSFKKRVEACRVKHL
jgi:hypothetical protein